jgi:hypothetical protein
MFEHSVKFNVLYLTYKFLLKHVIEGWVEGRIEITEDEARICKQLLGNHMEMGRHCIFKEEIL